MRWKRIGVICALALGLSCGDEFTNTADFGLPADTGAADGVTDTVGSDAAPGTLELVSGGISTLGGISMTETKLEGKPDYEVTDDGLEYSGVHGDQCTADKVLCITEGGFIP